MNSLEKKVEESGSVYTVEELKEAVYWLCLNYVRCDGAILSNHLISEASKRFSKRFYLRSKNLIKPITHNLITNLCRPYYNERLREFQYIVLSNAKFFIEKIFEKNGKKFSLYVPDNLKRVLIIFENEESLIRYVNSRICHSHDNLYVFRSKF
ncbi:MAG: hypothetical protein KatS3mg001_204 [Candidatus Pacearchaeota archaeon]|nr:MAG: hypothetical protein KatS3mg001_204 [Candidatus Pacearchaeota archaeon]